MIPIDFVFTYENLFLSGKETTVELATTLTGSFR